VPYVTGFGILKQSGDPRAFIAVGAKGNTTTWSKETELLTVANYKTHVTPANIGAATSSSVGTLSSLKTSAKGNLVAAINELFQNANNGKQLIATAIGSPLSSSDTFSAMSTKITTMSTNLKNFLVKCGATIESGKEGLNDLISLLISDSVQVKFPISFNLNSLPISCGQYHAAVLKKDGTIATVGYNYSGQLGTGNNNNAFAFIVPYNAGSNIIQVVCGGSHTAILKSDGSVMVTGENSSGQLGINTQDDMTSFTNMLNVNNDIIKVACGTNHTLVLKSDGTVWGTGNSSSGQLGTGTSTSVKTLTKSNLTNVVDIIANGNQSFAIDKMGDVWCTGLNGNGQLGMGNYTSYNSFVKVTSLSNVKQIACGANHTMVLKTDGTVWATGYNYYGQLGLGTSGASANTHSFTQVSINSVSHIACGSHHSALVKTDGTLWACGYNNQGQLGLSGATNRTTFTQVTTNVSNAQYVFCGGNYTYYIRKDGSVWSCGGNDKGQLGVGTTTDSFTFVGLSSSLLG
jgi:alpha-tubulin suppressor-like RCC1 family protein